MSNEWPLWEVFIRGQHGLSHRHVGSLHAPDAEMAIRNARDVYTRRNEGLSIWVVPSNEITASSPEEAGPLFEPSQSKVYRHPTFFDIPKEVGGDVMDAFQKFCLRMGDNTLILGQRTGEWCGHAPVLEEDIAFANMGLDLIGQTQFWLKLAGEVEGKGRSADDLAFLRAERQYLNCLLVEQPNSDFAIALMRQYLFDAWHLPMLEGLTASRDERVAAIAEKVVKEVRYHIDRSRDLVIGLGDGTTESHARIQGALNTLWPFVADLLATDEADEELFAQGIIPDPEIVAASFRAETAATFAAGKLETPQTELTRTGGRNGLHSEHMGYILSEMQYLQRTYPGVTW